MKRIAAHSLGAFILSLLVSAASAQQPGREVYRCPGNPVLYTDTLSAKEAKEKGCRLIEGAPITVVQGVKRPTGGAAAPAPAASRAAEQRIDANDQRARDNDARRILEGELQQEEQRLAQLQKEYNNGEPERLGEERNFQKYLDRVAEMKAAILRKEGDIAAIKRELAKLPK